MGAQGAGAVACGGARVNDVMIGIQARVNSSRLPRKPLQIIGNRSAIFHVWARARLVAPMRVLVPWRDVPEFRAVLPGSEPDPEWGDPGFIRGTEYRDENDVLYRYADHLGSDICVRVTADCPFVAPDGIQAVIQAVRDGADYARLHPIPNGLDAEAFTYKILMDAHRKAKDPYDREHVTPWIRRHAKRTVDVPLYAHLPRYRWTLDTQDDLAWFREVASEINCDPPHPTVDELLALLARRPDLAILDEVPCPA